MNLWKFTVIKMRDYQKEVEALEAVLVAGGISLNRPLAEIISSLLPQPTAKTVAPAIVLSDDQEKAWTKIQAWLTTSDPYFILR